MQIYLNNYSNYIINISYFKNAGIAKCLIDGFSLRKPIAYLCNTLHLIFNFNCEKIKFIKVQFLYFTLDRLVL